LARNYLELINLADAIDFDSQCESSLPFVPHLHGLTQYR